MACGSSCACGPCGEASHSAPDLVLRPGSRGSRRPPLVLGGGPGYLSVARRAELKFIVLPTGRQEVSPAFSMEDVNRFTIQATVSFLSAPQFSISFDSSNDTENWYFTGAAFLNLTFNTPGSKSQLVSNNGFRFMRLRYAISAAGTAAFASAVWRWKQ